jgi:hypothetical protein
MPSGRRSTVAPKLCITSTCGSISRMPRLQPLTSSSMRATPKRASSPGTSMIELRISSGRRCKPSSKRVCRWCTSSTRAGEVHRDVAAQRAEDLEDLLHVGDLGDAAQAHRLARQQRGAQDREDGVLVRRRDEPAAQRRAAVDDEVGHVRAGARR